MLNTLSIRNVVLIPSLDLNFKEGLGVFTGQTGAGKSILLDSLSLVLGARADTGLIRHGEKSLSVTASFDPIPPKVKAILEEQDIVCSESELLIRRTVTQDGKSKAFINDEPVSAGLLKTIGAFLVEINGQFATQGLLDNTTHRSFLDAFGVPQTLIDACETAYHNYQEIHLKHIRLQEELQKTLMQKEFLEQSLQDLEALHIKENEEEILTQKRTKLMNSEKVIESINQVYQFLNEENRGILNQLSHITRPLEQATKYAPDTFETLIDTVYQAQELLTDVSCQIESAIQEFADTEELPQIDERLFRLKDMARKHQVSVAELPAFTDTLRGQLDALDHSDTLCRELAEKEEESLKEYELTAQALHQARVQAGLALDKQVQKELPDLKLEKALFKTQVFQQEQITPQGKDQVLFTVSTNKTPFAPLNKIASGGELSRFMLALKINLAQKGMTPTLIFDEVDSGVGGATADAVGCRLSKLSKSCQVLVVTHSPQVASYAQQHFCVSKEEEADKIVTHVTELDDKSKIEEIARMLSGAAITDTAYKMAQELVNKAV